MTGASIIYRAYVPCSGSLGIDREPVAVRTCARLRWRAHSDINPGSQQARNPASHQSAAVSSPFGSVIASILPDWRKLARAIERTRTPIALARAIFVRGQRTILRFIGALGKALRSLCSSAFVPLVDDCRQPASRVFHTFQFPPVLSSALSHGKQHGSRSIGNGQNPIGEVRNVVR